MNFIGAWYLTTETALGVEPGDLYSQEKIVATMNNILKLWRQALNGTGNAAKREEFTNGLILPDKPQITVGICAQYIKAYVTSIGLPISKEAPSIGIVTPCLALFSIFFF